jgi:hypothetical protein
VNGGGPSGRPGRTIARQWHPTLHHRQPPARQCWEPLLGFELLSHRWTQMDTDSKSIRLGTEFLARRMPRAQRGAPFLFSRRPLRLCARSPSEVCERRQTKQAAGPDRLAPETPELAPPPSTGAAMLGIPSLAAQSYITIPLTDPVMTPLRYVTLSLRMYLAYRLRSRVSSPSSEE